MQRVRETLVIVLVVLLPFHAFGVTVLTRLVAGPGHAPLTALALWKEALVVALIGLALAELASKPMPKEPAALPIDIIDRLVCFFVLLAVVVTAFKFAGWGPFLYGAKYDLLPLILLGTFKLVPWSQEFGRRLLKALMLTGVAVAALGILSAVVPQSVFTALGYSDLHSLYVPSGPLAPFQQLGGSALRRVQSVMSGPNQLGIWLLIPLAATWVGMVRGACNCLDFRRMTALAVLASCLALTFSRSAWIGAAVLVAAGMLWMFPGKRGKQFMLWTGGVVCALALVLFVAAPSTLTRVASTKDHLTRPLLALQTISANPLGLGLGTAGPASNRFSDACVHLEAGADAAWAQAHPQLCVFVGETQVQPAGAPCDCPVLPENWYLQIGIETGVLGLLLFLALLHAVWTALRERREITTLAMPAALALLGTAVAALFLHAWEDAAVAYTVWILAAVAISAKKPA